MIGVIVGAQLNALATSGRDLEDYGPVATAPGGASFPCNSGAGAMISNPATLGLMPLGSGIGLAHQGNHEWTVAAFFRTGGVDGGHSFKN